MLLSKVAIGSRAFSNGDASREKSGIETEQRPGLQGVGEKIKKGAAFGRAANSVSFCAPNKIFASSQWEQLCESFAAGEEKKMVGATGFEPATASSQSWCSTKLSYAPDLYDL
jgi:hypothetical protein